MPGTSIFSKYDVRHEDNVIIIVHRLWDTRRIQEAVTTRYTKYRGVACPGCGCEWLVQTQLKTRAVSGVLFSGFRCRKCGQIPVVRLNDRLSKLFWERFRQDSV